MTGSEPPRRPRPRTLLPWVPPALVVVLVAVAGSYVVWRRQYDGQGMTIEARDPATISAPWPRAEARAPSQDDAGPPFLTSVSPDGRYFLDQYGTPFLVKGDSPWALTTRLTPDQAGRWLANREEHGFNAAIVSLIGATGNGGPEDDGTTVDGLQPFVDGNVLAWKEPYWQRMTSYLRMAADHGITVMLYPIDGWTIGHSFVPDSVEQCRRYGRRVAERFRDLPNIVWMSGGDYFPATDDPARGSDVDHCIDAMMHGVRDAGDGRPFSIQLGYDKSVSTENPYWADRVDWNFVYTYYPTYRAVLEAYARRPSVPAVLGESNYEGENNQPDTAPTTDETLRRQVLWALTSGATGEFVGSDDWEFHDGWERRLDTPAVSQVQRLRDLFSRLPWWRLVPDTGSDLVTGGRGAEVTTDEPMDVLDSDYVTAARTPDGRTAVVYVPTRRTISVDRSQVAAGVRVAWVDPTTGARRPVPLAGQYTTPGANAGGDGDWLLLFTT